MKTDFTIARLLSRRMPALRGCLSALLFVALLPASPLAAADNDEQKVKNYIEKQKAAGVAPKPSNPNWKAGFTCNDLKQFSFEEYQECRYYYAVHGRFYKT